jgi:maltooligosyltrehalose trehalohydrolase
MIIYELHVGTFTGEGTFEAIIDKLEHFIELGINTIEIMPVSQFPGERNWGYDGVYPFAPQESYGGSEGLKKLINACHKAGIAVILDAVYNHMGPEGNYLSQYGPYFTEKYHTPWGSALNFDDKYSDEVRNFFLENVAMWLEEYHFDGLRLDAVHEIIDTGAIHFLKEISLKADEIETRTGRKIVVIAESDLNDTRIVDPYEKGGYGLEGQWADDFHHSLHTLITGEDEGYYKDYGHLEHMAKAFKQGFVYDGIYSEFRKRRVGNNPSHLGSSKFVVCIQNHDQIGNRMLGERLSSLVNFEKLKLAAGIMLVSPYVPLIFMGEEYGEDRPFQYFVSHGDKELVKAVQEGRKREFEYFNHRQGEFPDPVSEKTYERSRLNWDFKKDNKKKVMFEFYQELISLRKNGNFNSFRNKEVLIETYKEQKFFTAFAPGKDPLFAVFNFLDNQNEISLPDAISWEKILASGEKKWNGPSESVKSLKNVVSIPPTSISIFKAKIEDHKITV